MIGNLFARLWNDEAGAVVATEYLMLGSIVAVGGTGGMVAMRDSMVDEYKEFGQSVREVRRANSGSAGTPATPVTTGTPAAPQYTFGRP